MKSRDRESLSRGVTLIELVIVVSLIAVFAALVTSGFANFYRGRNPELFVKDFSGYVRYLQFKAVEDGKIYRIAADDENGLRLSSFGQGDREFVPAADPMAKRFTAKGNFSIRTERGRDIDFFPDGTVTRSRIEIFEGEKKIADLTLKNRLGTLQVDMHA